MSDNTTPNQSHSATSPDTWRLAVLADAHLPKGEGTVQEMAVRWAVQRARSRACHVLVAAGDMTAEGDLESARRVQRMLRAGGLAWTSTPGNADLRTVPDADSVRTALTRSVASMPLLLVDTSEGVVSQRERARVARRLREGASPAALVTHWPPDELPDADRSWFAELCCSSSIEIIIAGHKHFDGRRDVAGLPLYLVRGLDPDKAKHGLPALAIFERSGGRWRRQDIPCVEADPRRWRGTLKQSFREHLGISAMNRPLAGVAEAADHAVPVLELRSESALEVDRGDLARQLGDWRRHGGRYLSLHLPNLAWDTASGAVSGTDRFHEAVELARDLAANHVTVHVPRTSLADLSTVHVKRQFLDVYCHELAVLQETLTSIGIENLHRRSGEPVDEGRGFGYLPDECLAWVTQLRPQLPGVRVGLQLDIGHARNNPPFSRSWTLGRWYAAVGRQVVGYHLHQVTAEGNHQPFQTPYGPLLSLASFFWAWRTGQLNPAPMFLEIRTEPSIQSWCRLRDYLHGYDNAFDTATRESAGGSQ